MIAFGFHFKKIAESRHQDIMEANITRTEHNVADYCTAAYGGSRDGQLDYTAASVQNEARCRNHKLRVE